MADDEELNPETEGELSEEEQGYEFSKTEEPERKIDLGKVEVSPEDAGIDGEDMPGKTDLQAAMKYLLPKYKLNLKDGKLLPFDIDSKLQPIMVSRIFPDNYLDLNYLLVMSMLEECEGEADIDVSGIVSLVQAATSIGYEGKGRFDVLEIAGVAHEEEMEKLTKELGL